MGGGARVSCRRAPRCGRDPPGPRGARARVHTLPSRRERLREARGRARGGPSGRGHRRGSTRTPAEPSAGSPRASPQARGAGRAHRRAALACGARARMRGQRKQMDSSGGLPRSARAAHAPSAAGAAQRRRSTRAQTRGRRAKASRSGLGARAFCPATPQDRALRRPRDAAHSVCVSGVTYNARCLRLSARRLTPATLRHRPALLPLQAQRPRPPQAHRRRRCRRRRTPRR